MISTMTVSGWPSATEQDGRRGRRALRWVQLTSGIGTMVIMSIGAYLIFTKAIPSPYSGGSLSSGREDVRDVGLALTVLLFLIGAVVAWRAGMRPFRHPMEIWSLPRGQYRRSARWVRCGAPAPEGEVAATTLVARSMSRLVKGLLLFASVTLNLAVQALVMTNAWWAALTWLGVALAVTGMFSVYRDGHLARRWLHAHSDEATSEVTGR